MPVTLSNWVSSKCNWVFHALLAKGQSICKKLGFKVIFVACTALTQPQICSQEAAETLLKSVQLCSKCKACLISQDAFYSNQIVIIMEHPLQMALSLPTWLKRLRRRYCCKASFAGSSPSWEGRLVANAQDQQPFEPGEWGLRVVLSGHFCASLHIGHARKTKSKTNTDGSSCVSRLLFGERLKRLRTP